MEKFIVARDDTIQESWPDLVKTKSGALLCVFTECVHHADRTGSRLMMNAGSSVQGLPHCFSVYPFTSFS